MQCGSKGVVRCTRTGRHSTIAKLLAHTKLEFRKWNRQAVGNFFDKANALERDILSLRQQEDRGRGLSSIELAHLRHLLDDYNGTLRLQEILWRQKPWVKWLMQGDTNFAFSHLTILVRRCSNKISQIQNSDDELIIEEKGIRDIFL